MVQYPDLKKIHTIAFDFDGVFTDNKVYVDQDGKESVCCDRRDGLGIDFLRKAAADLKHIEVFILSTEANSVVSMRANKMRLRCHSNTRGKLNFFEKYFKERFPDEIDPFASLIYLGNDLNDIAVIEKAGFSVVPNDAHPLVKEKASLVIPVDGGKGFVRSFVEGLLGINLMKVGEINELVLNS